MMAEGCVSRIVDRDLVLNISKLEYRDERGEGLYCTRSDVLDADSSRDGVLTASDFVRNSSGTSSAQYSCILQDWVVKSLSGLGIISRDKEEALKHFFKLYNRLKAVNDIVIDGIEDDVAMQCVPSWKQMHSDTWGRELEFDQDAFWSDQVVPIVTRRGILSNYYDYGLSGRYSIQVFMAGREDVTGRGVGYQLAEELRLVLADLCGMSEVAGRRGKGETLNAYEVDTSRLPTIFRRPAYEMLRWYNGIVEFFDGYREIECDGSNCISDDEYELHGFRTIRNIAPKPDPEDVDAGIDVLVRN